MHRRRCAVAGAHSAGRVLVPGVVPVGAPDDDEPDTPAVSVAGPHAVPDPHADASPPPPPADPLAGWTLEQKVGQLLMVGLPVRGSRDTTAALVRDRHVGGVFLAGRSQAPVQNVLNLVDAFRAMSHDPVRLLVATDQEGGQVRVLQGPGFTAAPPATQQVTLPDLAAQATTWGTELRAAGVDVDLAPVADLVPPELGTGNAPIGRYGRNYGSTPESVVAGAGAFAAGMRAAGVVPTVKHFPGLGRVTQNTDTTAGVHDSVTTADDASVGVFRDVVAAASRGDGPRPWVMMSTAVYDRIDPTLPAAFSPTVVGLLRGTLGFDGVVVTDDVSHAAQVQAWSPGDRAVLAVEAGVDVVLASADPSTANAMLDALVAKAQADPAFAAKVDAAARRVVAAKG
ncbi:glycoside hydrolase family 3 N-terminal domain-containing protein [Xylanimonas protaetiae]|uniref:glycoside hydrolase family 3 N-terminal domain-containing protein n=1 Tax=Xylanimonas protaetiae TaxID=2509457 RepID=UPI001F5DC127|nr:glycoside hydrolase family 3 N-terminal domain-containing protein [Xylanimonas protaetiae]